MKRKQKMTFENFREGVLRAAMNASKDQSAAPDSDWAPQMVLLTSKGDIVVVDLRSAPTETKDLRGYLKTVFRNLKPLRLARLMSVWYTNASPPQINDAFDIESLPDRKEAVVAFITDLNDGKEEFWWAKINRSEAAPPQLSEFVQIPVDLFGSHCLQPTA
jgi:hypothetical protein